MKTKREFPLTRKQVIFGILGVLLLGAAVAAIVTWLKVGSMVLAGIGAVGGIGGIICLAVAFMSGSGDTRSAAVMVRRRGEPAEQAEAAPGAVPAPNSLNIYATTDPAGAVIPEAIEFAYVAQPYGHKQKCLNNGKYYYVHINSPGTDELRAFVLPDTAYFDPAEMGRVLTMPCYRRLFRERKQGLAKYRPILVAVVLLVTLFLYWLGGQS